MAEERPTYRLKTRAYGETSVWPEFELHNSQDNAVDLTGASVDITWRRKTPSGRVQLKQSTTAGNISIIDATAGRLTMTKVTLDWEPGLYIADIKVTHPNWTEIPLRLELLIIESATK